MRAINFSGGGVDTAMHLGVTHALLVSQGRAPDVVVGLSAGALHAAALAEVMRTGQELEPTPQAWRKLSKKKQVELHSKRMKLRFTKLRSLLEEFRNAPAELYEQMLPDAYQVNSLDPLRPVESPAFLAKERRRRIEALGNRSGLVRLYNDLLRVQLTFGTLTRAVRRVLGIRAASEVRSPLGRVVVSLLELLRLWILIGNNLHRLGPLAARLAISCAPTPRSKGETAGTLIFRFRPIRDLMFRIGGWAAFAVGLCLWVIPTVALLLFPYHAAGLFASRWPLGDPARTQALIAWSLYGVLVLGALVTYFASPSLRRFEHQASYLSAAKTLWHGFWATVVPIAVWAAVATVVFLVADAVVTQEELVVERATLRDFWKTLAFNPWSPIALGICVLLVGLVMYLCGRKRLLRALLNAYSVRSSLVHPYALEQILARIFDPEHHGRVDLKKTVDESLNQDWVATDGEETPDKTIASYATGQTPIHLGFAVANLKTGRLEVVSSTTKVVKGLIAANAVVPILPPQNIDGKDYIDAGNVANEPMQALIEMLKHQLHPEAHVVHVYSASPLPFYRSLSEKQGEREDLIKIAWEGYTLRKYRDASLERRLTELYTRALPDEGRALVKVPDLKDPKKTRPFVRAWVAPIEPEEPLDLTLDLLLSRSKADTRAKVLTAVADGCRAALEVMILPSLERPDPQLLPCGIALGKHLEARAKKSPEIQHLVQACPPPTEDPGLPEVCAHCKLTVRCAQGGDDESHDQTLVRLRRSKQDGPVWEAEGPAWPHERERFDKVDGDPHFEMEDVQGKQGPKNAFVGWPRREDSESPRKKVKRPTVSLLFSGGVFRGVYQLGSLNALTLLDLKPDLIVGSSVGSITGAMAAGVFPRSGHPLAAARLAMARVAAGYLALDHIVLTDRFADLVRNFTVRAADAHISLRQADRVFRRYDAAYAARFNRELRMVLAGIERVLYTSPFDVARITCALRDHDRGRALTLVRQCAQDLLDRMGVGLEALGAEPLKMIIEEYIEQPLVGKSGQPATLGDFYDLTRVRLLVTATNLVTRELEILGSVSGHGASELAPGDIRLGEALLASSAFPGVFRPRWSDELSPHRSRRHQYIDGGVMDNVPFFPAAEHLRRAAEAGAILHVPDGAPHLIINASLEPEDQGYVEQSATWMNTWNRAGELGYNRKLEQLAAAQRHLRAIRQVKSIKQQVNPRFDTLDLELMVIKPRWLCGTFAFHPMMGFRRRQQAQNMAHGCASTLANFAGKPDGHLDAWGVDKAWVPGPERWVNGPVETKPDRCWLTDEFCPFSRRQLKAHEELPEKTKDALHDIYLQCLRPRTHQARKR